MTRVQTNTGKKTKVQQSFKDSTNVSTIMNKFIKQGVTPSSPSQNAQYLDWTQIGDYTEMLSQVTAVQQQFQQFPSKIRSRFNNSPQKFLEFLDKEGNRKEAELLGLIPTPEKPEAERAGAPVPKPAPKSTSAPEDPQLSLDDKKEGTKG